MLAAALALPRAWRWWRSSRRSARAEGDDAATARASWTELLERLADLQALPRGATVREQAADLTVREHLSPAGRDAVDRLAGAVERALYAMEPDPASGLTQDRLTVLTEVAGTRDLRRRLAARWFPAPVPDVFAGEAPRVAEHVR